MDEASSQPNAWNLISELRRMIIESHGDRFSRLLAPRPVDAAEVQGIVRGMPEERILDYLNREASTSILMTIERACARAVRVTFSGTSHAEELARDMAYASHVPSYLMLAVAITAVLKALDVPDEVLPQSVPSAADWSNPRDG